MLQVVPQMKIRVAVEPIDGRKGIDSLAQLCREKLKEDPYSGGIFIFRNRRGTMLKVLNFDGQGWWLATKRLAEGRFKWWPKTNGPGATLQPHQVQVLLAAGDPSVDGAPVWRSVSPESSSSNTGPSRRGARTDGANRIKRMPLPG